ncbi:MAG: dihydropteroate synthase [Propionibacteriaceae bacterium]
MDLMHANRTLVMGIVNVTPDSFSDGGDHDDPRAAIAHGFALAEQGADIIDVGGESTRPGAVRPTLDEELNRVIPVVKALAIAGIAVSVDTMRAEVAQASAAAGAVIINDVSGGLADESMMEVVAQSKLLYICMHWRDHGATMDDKAAYDDVVAEVLGELGERVEACHAAGITRDKLIFDPGIGFAKKSEHNWELLRHLDQLERWGYPLLLGVSRKRFLGELLADDQGMRPAKERDDATAALTTLLADRGVWAVRTHSVRQHRDAIAVVQAMKGI